MGQSTSSADQGQTLPTGKDESQPSMFSDLSSFLWTSAVLEKIQTERRRQNLKWGDQRHPNAWWTVILGEEFGEACKAVYEGNEEELVTELVQVAAVATAWVEDILRRKADWEREV